MASLSVLANVPGYGGYLARRGQIEDQQAQAQQQELSQASVLQKLAAQSEATQKEAAFRQELAAAPTPEDKLMVAQKYMGANQLGTSIQGGFNRQAQIDATQATREQTLSFQREQEAGRRADASALRQQRMAELKLRLSDSRVNAEEARALRKELAMETIAMRRELAGMRQEQSPFAQKQRELVEGKQQLNSILDELEIDYAAFEKLGADISPQRGSVANVMNRIASSAPGQLVAGAVGTKEQEIRDSINMKRASLMAALKKATGMGATQLNSNVELQFYLKMATDPTMSREANRRGLKYLREAYGVGAGGNSNAAPEGVDPADWAVMTPEERALWRN